MTYLDIDGKPHRCKNGEMVEEKDAVLMQFTGLKDKNGKEIYEGDVMQDKNVLMKGVDEFGEMVFKDGKFQLKIHMVGKDGYNYFDLINCWDDFEIIGNIYENPELLKEKDTPKEAKKYKEIVNDRIIHG